MPDYLSADIRTVKGVGDAVAKKLEKLGIHTIGDMLKYYPKRLEDRSTVKPITEITDGETVCIRGTVFSHVETRFVRKNMTIYKLTVRDESGSIEVFWYNNKYIKSNLLYGHKYTFYGQIRTRYGKKEMLNPLYEKEGQISSTGRIVPIYQMTKGLSQKTLLNIMKKCLELAEKNGLDETLPDWMRKEWKLKDVMYATQNIHFPKNLQAYKDARNRFVFEEFLLLNMGMRTLSARRNTMHGYAYTDFSVSDFVKGLSFELTKAQKRVCTEIMSDLKSDIPMNRLVQGDVGSGKTVVAALCLYLTVKNGFQGAMMAPTEILADQHYNTLSKMLPGINVALLKGSTKQKEKREILQKLESGEIQVIVGTHALFSDDVKFFKLAMVITDEQHRFGVRQRAALAEKSDMSPHVLVMTATPIPRTLALILYNDLNISVIDQLPPGRQVVDTFVVDEKLRRRVYKFVEKEVSAGHQVYVVCPMVEESDTTELKSVVSFAEKLQKEVLSGISVGLIHGRMKAAEKDEIMKSFVSGDISVLVSTTVIEVGVNVPSATLMVVENAERFGLSQLHQLRGRVGRGKDKSYCILFYQGTNEITKQRMDIMKKTNDGFVISQKDLELRGPGEIFGTRQHGLPELKIGDMITDAVILKQASQAADALLKTDRKLKEAENKYLKQALINMFYEGDANIFN